MQKYIEPPKRTWGQSIQEIYRRAPKRNKKKKEKKNKGRGNKNLSALYNPLKKPHLQPNQYKKSWPINNIQITPRPEITKKDLLHSNNRNIHIVENKSIPFAPNSPENAKGGCHPSLLTFFTHKGTLPREESLPNSERENPLTVCNSTAISLIIRVFTFLCYVLLYLDHVGLCM